MNPSTSNATPERRRVLIVDDDPTMVHVLARTLMDCAQLYFSVRGEDALKKLDAHKPDLMLIDVDMPDLSGYEVMQRMLQNPRTQGTQVIMVTSHTEESYRRRAMELGAVDFFVKPINRQEIRDRVDQLMNQEVETIELSFSPHGDFTSKTAAVKHRASDDWAGHESDFAPTQIFGSFTEPPPSPKAKMAAPAPKAAPITLVKPVASANASADHITSELFERMSAILEQTESIRHTDQKSLSPAVSHRIARIEEECAEVIQLLVTLSDSEKSAA
ncbi:PleD family two-component system response regulator [Hydrogenophaga sp.]|uniref:response regulator n=1 Tax=Hydrogenophaga sp. TaxID=1904254 RepID=UPI00272F053A|nr:response regulator [Hydrogenophaga sp.]MDP2019135.1 response regulator [Hydrogenophaga sp.]MDP3168398.1 response regulator [Hydrogenophaga sp.]MDP3811009.1 response regulator [Hydrogenophaga sp.]